MRLTTVLMMSVLMVLAVAVYADECATTTTAPTGAGPAMTSETTSTTTTTTTTVAPTPPGTTGTMMAMAPEVDQLNTTLVCNSFGVDAASVTSLRQAGWTWGDINMLANIANKTGQPILSVADLRSQGTSWSDIGSKFNVASVDLATPTLVRTRVAGFTTEYGYEPVYYRTDVFGNPVLTRWDYRVLRRQGYSRDNIAIASNIAAQTGVPVKEVLAENDRGQIWPQIIREYNLNENQVMDVSRFPFGAGPGMTETVTTTTTSTRHHRMEREKTTTETTMPSGAGPSMAPPPPPVTRY